MCSSGSLSLALLSKYSAQKLHGHTLHSTPSSFQNPQSLASLASKKLHHNQPLILEKLVGTYFSLMYISDLEVAGISDRFYHLGDSSSGTTVAIVLNTLLRIKHDTFSTYDIKSSANLLLDRFPYFNPSGTDPNSDSGFCCWVAVFVVLTFATSMTCFASKIRGAALAKRKRVPYLTRLGKQKYIFTITLNTEKYTGD